MAADPSLVTSSEGRLREASQTYAHEIESIVTNVRWLATLVLAEIAGIASYRQLQGQDSLSLGFAFVVMLHAVSLLCFVASVILARERRRGMELLILEKIKNFSDVLVDKTNTQQQGDAEIVKVRDSALSEFARTPEHPRTFETLGMVFFVSSSVLAAFILFWNEIAALF